jgi:hypothetical protein
VEDPSKLLQGERTGKIICWYTVGVRIREIHDDGWYNKKKIRVTEQQYSFYWLEQLI